MITERESSDLDWRTGEEYGPGYDNCKDGSGIAELLRIRDGVHLK